MIRLGVVSDTHIPLILPKLPALLISHLAGVDGLVHAGDLVSLEVLNELRKIAPVYAVAGNMDGGIIGQTLPKKRVEQFEGVRIGITHGGGSPQSLIKRVEQTFSEENLAVIIFGHSHKPLIKISNNHLLFNPGSATDKIYTAQNTYGLLLIESNRIQAEIRDVSTNTVLDVGEVSPQFLEK